MRKRILGFVLVSIFLLISFFGIRLYIKDSSYYNDAYEVNQSLAADGFKLMMSVEEVRNKCGVEEAFEHGFGGNFYGYPSKGVEFSVSTNYDYDLKDKIGDLRIKNPNYSLFDFRVGMEESKASEILKSRGYKENIDDRGKSYLKGCVYIDFSVSNNIISEIRIIVRDKKFDPNIIY